MSERTGTLLANHAVPTRRAGIRSWLPRPAVALLTLFVVALHLLLLQAEPAQLGLTPAVAAPQRFVFITRQIERPPEASAKPAAAVPRRAAPVQPEPGEEQIPPPAALPATQPSADQTSASNQAIAQAPPAQTAPDLIADQAAANDASRAPPAAAPVASEAAAPPSTAETTALALAIPGSVRLTYAMSGQSKGLNYLASGVLTWVQDGGSYDARMVVSAFLLGARSLTSVGEITADGLAPRRYSDKSRGELAAHFEAAKGKITFSANTADALWQRGAQDRLSVFFQLAAMLAGSPSRFTEGSKIPIYTAGPRDVDTWSFTVLGEESLKLPMGTLAALKVSRDPRREFDQKVEAWFAPSLAYLPVRIKITQHNGDFVDQQLAASGTP